MVGQDARQHRLVLGLEQRVDGAGGKLGKGSVGGRKDRERACSRKGLGEAGDRKSVVEGKSVSVRVVLGGRRSIKKKKKAQYIIREERENITHQLAETMH